MRRATILSGVAAMVVLAAGAARAQSYTLPYFRVLTGTTGGDASFINYDLFNSALENPSNSTQFANWENPYAAVRGAIWMNTGSGPALVPGGSSLNMELWINDYDNEWGSGGDGTGGADGWLLEQRVLISDGGANGNIEAGNSGCFSCGAQLGVPGTYWQDYWTQGAELDTRFQFHLYAWTGTETTYAAALAAGDCTADAIWTQNVGNAYCDDWQGPPPIPPGLNNPAMILEDFPGDANRDGKVDINDLTIVLSNYGLSGSPLDVTYSEGDFTGDGKVDINDLTIVLAHYGDTIGSSPIGMAAVPEPSILVLAAAGLAGLLAYAYWFSETRCAERTGG
jgi:hypothetical protein